MIITRFDEGEDISVTVAPSGFVIDARSEFGYKVEVTKKEQKQINYILGYDDDDCH
jgi:hypothetical protein